MKLEPLTGEKLLKTAVNQILKDPSTWDQTRWHSDCGTKHCIAGHCQILAGKPMNKNTAAKIPFSLKDYVPGKSKVVTRGGSRVTILLTDVRCRQPIVGLIEGCEVVLQWGEDGAFHTNSQGCSSDIFILTKLKLRAWKDASEVPTDCVLRGVGRGGYGSKIVGFSPSGLDIVVGINSPCLKNISFDELFKTHEHSTDGGATWKPCGKIE